MSGINGLYVASNPTALTAQFNLVRNMGELSTTLTRLSTGLRINSAKDDPAGLIASELLKADIAGTNAAITNVQRANGVLSTADSAMANVGGLLTTIKGLVVEAANSGAMNADQIAANQLQVDATLEAIDQIAGSTTYGGKKILDGSLDFNTTNTSGGGVSDVTVYSANFGTASNIAVNVDVKEAAKRGTLIYNGTGVSQKTTIDLTGSTGTKSLTFGKGATNAEIAAAINAVSDSTGVQARVEGAASRGTVTLNGTGSNNGIVITANEEGAAAGNYSFKIVSGDQNGVRIASQATGSTPGVVEIMLQKSYSASHKNVGGILDVTVTDDAAQATGVTIKKGTTNQAVYHDADSAATATTKDGRKTISINSGTAAADAVTSTNASKLNGWTFKVVADGAEVNGQTMATGTVDAIFDDEAKVAYINVGTDDAAAAMAVAVNRITGDEDYEVGTGITGTLEVGDEFTLGGGGAAGEVELTYKEGATVNDLLKLANNAGGNVSASLGNGVKGDALIKDLLTGNSRSFATAAAMTASPTTSSVTANEVIQMINSTLGDKFTATLMSGDNGTGFMTFMDAAVDYGDVNLDNALRFTGMDSGPIVRMVTTDANGDAIKNQKLSVTLLNPTEEDIANGIHTPVLQINLATDADGNSITTAQDIVDLFNSLTPEQTGGVSATLILPDGVDPNGRTWTTDNCGNVIETTDCNAKFGTGIVQPTGTPGVCEIQQNDLVLLGTNQKLVDDYAVARIGTVADHTPGGVAEIAATAGSATTELFSTTSNHSGLAGVTLAFTTDANEAGFDEALGTLMVYLSPETQATFSVAAVEDAVNGSIAQNWQGIRQFSGATGNATTVSLETAETTTAGFMTLFNGTPTVFASRTTGAVDDTNERGLNTYDPALTIKALDPGTGMAGVKVVLEHDPALAEPADPTTDLPAISVTFDEKSGVLTIKANGGTNGVDAGALAEALNNDTIFQQHFSAEATLVTNENEGGAPAYGTDYGTVYFGSGNSSAATFTGGYKIQTAEKATATVANETSSGIGMTGANDSNERLVIEATDVGSENFVKVVVREGSFTTYCPLGLAMNELAGTDVVATVNGLDAKARGNNITLNTADLSLSLNSDGKVGSSSFTINGGGALFQIGPDVVSAQQKRVGIASMMTTAIGGGSGKLFQLKSGGTADLQTSDESRKLADKIINESISYVANSRGRIGALQSSLLDPIQTVLEDQLVSLTDAQGSIANADFAEESSKLTQLQLLIQSGMSTLGIANQLPQYAASLVR